MSSDQNLSDLENLSFETCASTEGKQVTQKQNVQPKSALKSRRKSVRKSLYLRPTQAVSGHSRMKTSDEVKATALMKASSNSSSKLTIPVSPEFRRSTRSTSKALTSAELEVMQVQAYMQTQNKRKSLANIRFKSNKTKSDTFQSTMKVSEKKLTVPKTPTFAKKKGKPLLETRSVDDSKLSISRNKREKSKKQQTLASKSVSSIGASSNKKMSLTIPKPFKLKTTERIGAPMSSFTNTNNTPSKMSSAEINALFVKNSRSSAPTPKKGKSSEPERKLTVPQGPSFRSRVDSAPRVMSHDEQEMMEMAAFEKNAFKAKPVDKKIFQSMGVMGVPKVDKKKATTFTEFNLKSDTRASSRKSLLVSSTVTATETETATRSLSQFKARPMPKYTKAKEAEEVTLSTAKKLLTQPLSPKLHGGRASSAPARRQRSRQSMIAEAPPSTIKKPTTLTQPKEFILRTSSRGSIYQDNFDKQMQRELELEKAAYEYKATPITNPTFQFKSHPAPVATQPQAFNLRSDSRHSIAVDNFKKEVERAEESEKMKVNGFHAKGLPKTHSYPHLIKPVVEQKKANPVQKALESDRRASVRKEYDATIAKRNEQMAKLQETVQQQQAEKENQTIKELRSKPISEGGWLFKAAPVMKHDTYKAPAPKEKKLTEPKSPNLQYGKTPRSSHSVSTAFASM